MYGEDVDLSLRLRGRGYRLAYCPWSLVNHLVTLRDLDSCRASTALKSALILHWLYASWLDFGLLLARTLCFGLLPNPNGGPAPQHVPRPS